jgi:hypothetical protein
LIALSADALLDYRPIDIDVSDGRVSETRVKECKKGLVETLIDHVIAAEVAAPVAK